MTTTPLPQPIATTPTDTQINQAKEVAKVTPNPVVPKVETTKVPPVDFNVSQGRE